MIFFFKCVIQFEHTLQDVTRQRWREKIESITIILTNWFFQIYCSHPLRTLSTTWPKKKKTYQSDYHCRISTGPFWHLYNKHIRSNCEMYNKDEDVRNVSVVPEKCRSIICCRAALYTMSVSWPLTRRSAAYIRDLQVD